MEGRRGSIKEETEGEKEVAREEGGRKLKERKSFMYYFGIMKIRNNENILKSECFPSTFTFIYILHTFFPTLNYAL